MGVIQYCTPEWLEECAKRYAENPGLQSKLKKISQKMCYLVKADPEWGIDNDIIFGAFFDEGKLLKLAFFTEEKAGNEADYILEATPKEWVSLLRKQNKFIARFMMQEVKLKQGERVDVLRLAPYANDLIDALTLAEMLYPDEMSPEELETYRAYINEFRAELGL